MGNLKPALEEHCTECGKLITRRAIAHIYENRVVCTPCAHRLHSADERREREIERAQQRGLDQAAELEWEENAPATAPQICFARELGISLPPEPKKWATSRAIDRRLKELDGHPEVEAILLEPHRRRHGVEGTAPRPRVSKLLIFWIVVCALILTLWIAGKF